jgi:hypothetical protein
VRVNTTLYAATLFLLSSQAFAQTPVPSDQVYIKEVNTIGSGCRPDSFALNLSSDKRAFTLTFSEFVAEIGPGIDPAQAYKNCAITLSLSVPSGWQYSIGTFNYRGFMDLAPQVRAEHSTSYFFQGTGQTGSFTAFENGPLAKSFLYTDRVGLASSYIPDTWSPCNADRALTFNPTIRLKRLEGASPDAQSFITNDSVDGEIVQQFGLVWRRCGGAQNPAPTPTPGSISLEKDAVYTVTNRLSGKCLDVKEAGLANGAPLQQWTCNGTSAQKFRLANRGGDVYSLVAIHSGKTLSVQNSFAQDTTPIIQWDFSNTSNQKFRVVPSANGSYTVRFTHAEKCMDVAGTSSDDGKAVHQYQCVGVADQDWIFKKVTDVHTNSLEGNYALVNDYSKKCLDVQGKSTANGALAQQWDCGSEPNQRFYLKWADGLTYNLVATHSNKCLSVKESSQGDLANIIQWDCAGSANQKVTVTPSVNGTYLVRFVHSNKCMDVSGTSDINGKLVLQYECVNVPDQNWILRK